MSRVFDEKEIYSNLTLLFTQEFIDRYVVIKDKRVTLGEGVIIMQLDFYPYKWVYFFPENPGGSYFDSFYEVLTYVLDDLLAKGMDVWDL